MVIAHPGPIPVTFKCFSPGRKVARFIWATGIQSGQSFVSQVAMPSIGKHSRCARYVNQKNLRRISYFKVTTGHEGFAQKYLER